MFQWFLQSIKWINRVLILKIKEELSQMNILVEDWGGKFQSQEISAKPD